MNHGASIYVVNKAHTITIEGFWSLLKRGIIGIYDSVCSKNLDAYVNKSEFRYNTKDLTERSRFDNLLSLSIGSKLTYCHLMSCF